MPTVRIDQTMKAAIRSAGLVLCASSALAQSSIDHLAGVWWRIPAPDANETGVVERSPRSLTAHGEALMSVFDPAADPADRCEHPGALRVILGPDPMSIEFATGRVLIRYALWAETRTIHLTRQETDPDLPHRTMGVSEGRVEDGRLVVETHSLKRGLNLTPAALWTSEEATLREEYFLDESDRLTLEMTLTDPVMLAEPWRLQKQWGRYDGDLLDDFDCAARETP